MTDSYTIYKQQQKQKPQDIAAQEPFKTLDELLCAFGMSSLQYVLDLQVFDSKALKEEPLAVLAARVGEDRAAFLTALARAGMDSLAQRQMLANALAKAAREGRITRGWAKPPPESCTHCAVLPAQNKKLLTCGRCKQAKYCSAGCQKAHWAAGHKAECKAPPVTKAGEWAAVDAGNGESLAAPSGWRSKEVGTGGWGGHPILGNGVVKDNRPE